MQKKEFKYFPEYEKWARFADRQNLRPDDSPCLEGVYFENPDIEEPVCLDLLVNGQVKVEIPNYLHKQLLNSIRKKHSGWDENRVMNFAAQILDALSRTPPIPWIQHNAWPVCCGDFCCYLGEWSDEQLTKSSPDGDGGAYLWTILEDSHRSRRDNPYHLWQEVMSGWTTIYMFQCFECNKLIAVDQSY